MIWYIITMDDRRFRVSQTPYSGGPKVQAEKISQLGAWVAPNLFIAGHNVASVELEDDEAIAPAQRSEIDF